MKYLVLAMLALSLATAQAQPLTTLEELTAILLTYKEARNEWEKALNSFTKAQSTLQTAFDTQSEALSSTTRQLADLKLSFEDYKRNVGETALAEIQHLDSQVIKARVTLYVLGGVAGVGMGAFSVKSFVDGDVVGGLIFAGLAVADAILIIINAIP